ncbi:arsenate reductase (glutaredoxin) [Pseudoprimorskyibacter insulae]|uniref:Arsenate reductase n=1 Tax=Pseudoprimorskyibacter insulae TaxID=1695997 RepID=A0A2R8APC7_9RHOB|nr:arsenate reductase (glutaredoxin) [Pseudoprimorskyibacter insulae]SPF77912.1 Arsenate reductase [Pseudoprimorskyibacter insulae]
MITIWHNPRCSKSREALAILQDAGVDITERRYLEDAPSLEELKAAREALGIPVIEMVRVKEALFKVLGLSRDMGDDALLKALAANPKLIERPVVFTAEGAVIGRPPERVRDIL